MSSSLLDSLSQLVTPDLLGQAASMLGESQGNVSRGVSAALPMLLGSVASRATDTNFASSLFKLVTDSRNDLGAVGNIAQLLTPGSSNSSISALGGQLLGSLFGNNTSAVTSALAGYAGIKPQSANSLLSMAAPMVLGVLGKSVRGGGLNMSSLASLLSSQKGAISAALPTGLNLDRYLAAPSAAMAAVAAPAAKSSIWRWLLPLLLVLGALLLLSRCMKKDEVVQSLPAPAPQAEVAPAPLPAPAPVEVAHTKGRRVLRRRQDGVAGRRWYCARRCHCLPRRQPDEHGCRLRLPRSDGRPRDERGVGQEPRPRRSRCPGGRRRDGRAYRPAEAGGIDGRRLARGRASRGGHDSLKTIAGRNSHRVATGAHRGPCFFCTRAAHHQGSINCCTCRAIMLSSSVGIT